MSGIIGPKLAVQIPQYGVYFHFNQTRLPDWISASSTRMEPLGFRLEKNNGPNAGASTSNGSCYAT
jgi:hypothetical protein